jgi:hypothetical protein
MGLFSAPQAYLATVHRRPFNCLVCAGGEFQQRSIKMNTTAAEFFDLGWANQSALGLLCTGCGHVHEFVGDAVELWQVDGGYPQD